MLIILKSKQIQPYFAQFLTRMVIIKQKRICIVYTSCCFL